MLDYVRLWLKRARLDANAAVRLAKRDPVLALYLVQQSTEKACKALLFAAGKEYKDVIKLRHSSLKAFLSFTELFVQIEWMKQSFSGLVAPGIYQELDRIKKWGEHPKENRKFWKDLARYDNVTIDKLLSIPIHYRMACNGMLQLIRNSPNLLLTSNQLEITDIVGVIEKYATDNFGHLTNETQIALASTFARAFTDAIGTRRIKEEVSKTGKVIFTGNEISVTVDKHFRFAELMVDLYIMSAITLPHESYTRYPSNPHGNGKPPRGCEQYDSSIGVFFHIKGLAKHAQEISNNLHAKAPMVTEGIQNSLAALRN